MCRRYSLRQRARIPCTAEDADRAEKNGGFSRYPLQVMGKQILVETPLVGRHQLRNVALAIAAAEELASRDFRSRPDRSNAAFARHTGRDDFRFCLPAREPEVCVRCGA